MRELILSNGGYSNSKDLQRLHSRFTELLMPVLDEIEALLATCPGAPDLAPLVRHALSERLLAVEAGKSLSWSGLVLLVSEGICGTWEHAVPAATAMELFATAADVFDDIEDQDNPGSLWGLYGAPIATNAATVLLMLSFQALTRLRQRAVPDQGILSVVNAFASAGILSCAGQHQDLFCETQADVGEESYIHIAEKKSGALVGLACHVGALLATSDIELVERSIVFGRNLGVAAQITNDVRSLLAKPGEKSDIVRRKKTLPIVYALRNTSGPTLALLKRVYEGDSAVDPQTEQLVRELINTIGATQYALTIADLHKQKALSILGSLRLKPEVQALLNALLK